MPAIVAFFVRQLIIIGVQLGIFSAIDKWVTPLLNKAIEAIMTTFGVNEDTASDILANETLTSVESLGLTVALSKARLPLVISDKLGFSTKGFQKRKLPANVEAKVSGKTVASVKSPKITTAEATELAKDTAAKRGLTFAKVNDVITFLLKIASFPFLVIFTLAQVVDFGNWNSGAYQTTWQKILAVVTFGALVPDPQIPKSKVLSSDVWNKIYNTYKERGAVGINDPYKNQTVLFSRQNLIDLVDQIGSVLLLETGEAGAKAVFAVATALIIFGEQTAPTVTTAPTSQPAYIPSPKVFTGVISQGNLSTGVLFNERPNDIIQSTQDLQDAAANNLAPFLASIGGRIIYELKIVSSIRTKDGFTQRGQSQQVISGYYKDGRPKYRTLVNKFAVLRLYILTDRGTRSKITEIVLGPTDAVEFRPSGNDLQSIEDTIKSVIFTSDPAEISMITTDTGSTEVKIAPPEPILEAQKPQMPKEMFPSIYDWGDGKTVTIVENSTAHGVQNSNEFLNYLGQIVNRVLTPGDFPPFRQNNVNVTKTSGGNVTFRVDNNKIWFDYGGLAITAIVYDPTTKTYNLVRKSDVEKTLATTEATTAKSVLPEPVSVTPTAEQKPKLGQYARTLYEFYAAFGKPLPKVQERSIIYAELGLGLANLYTGTAEQNIKLLAALKEQDQ